MSAFAAEVEAVEADDMEVGLDYWLPGDVELQQMRLQQTRESFDPCTAVCTALYKTVKSVHDSNEFVTQIASLFQAELQNIQKSLSSGEQEKVELVKSLACLKDDLTRLQVYTVWGYQKKLKAVAKHLQ